jgi:ribosomal protein S18 acetylase RimI-like enzyme
MQAIIPRIGISIRAGTVDDLPAIDALQKGSGKALGYFPTAQLRGYIETGGVLVGCDPSGKLIGYLISRDRYLKRDELGVIYQLCVDPSARRSLVGAALVKAAFERAAYGCRLFCLWCAQDLEANRFWESLGFVPIAFRAGSGKRKRVHIFWERRVRADDLVTPYWFPAQTSGGALRDDRLVFPIPPGKHWSDEMPTIAPRQTSEPILEDQRKPKSARIVPPMQMNGPVKHGPRQFGPPPPVLPVAQAAPEKPKRQKATRAKTDPMLVAAARELRDRWLEQMNAGEFALADSRYDIARIECQPPGPQRLLPAA